MKNDQDGQDSLADEQTFVACCVNGPLGLNKIIFFSLNWWKS